MSKVLSYFIILLFLVGGVCFVFEWTELIFKMIPENYRPDDFWGYVGFIIILIIFLYTIQWFVNQIRNKNE